MKAITKGNKSTTNSKERKATSSDETQTPTDNNEGVPPDDIEGNVEVVDEMVSFRLPLANKEKQVSADNTDMSPTSKKEKTNIERCMGGCSKNLSNCYMCFS